MDGRWLQITAGRCPAESQWVVNRLATHITRFGHIHEQYGVVQKEGTKYVNASICDVRYRPSRQCIVIDL